MIEVAIGLSCFAAGALGMAFLNTFLGKDAGRDTNPCDDACTIERLTAERDDWSMAAVTMVQNYKALEAENRDLRIDIAEKAKRLSDAGLQSAGGEV